MKRLFLALTATLAVAVGLSSPVAALQQDEDPEGVEVLARGPVHEAYAMPYDAQPQPSPVVPKEPPEPVEEVAPDQRPEGDNVVWIPGYWAWDTEAEDFLWVSGFWRDTPPGRHWVPGAWHSAEGGWQWVSGFWSAEDEEDIPYLPPLPEQTLERGPSTPAPSAESFYAPGCWIWRETRYAWRPGIWVAYRPGWTWCAAHYVWTPAGCVFVEGHWDHALHERGLLFAPVRVDRRVLARKWTYTPRYVVDCDALLGALFVRKATCQYAFGDYFGDRYEKAGYVPWVDYRPARNTLDVNYSYYRAEHARSDRWDEGLRALYTARRKGEVAPPPRTWSQQTKLVQSMTSDRSRDVTVNKTINLTKVQNVTVLAPLTKVDNTRFTALANLGGPPRGGPAKEVEAKKVVKLQSVSREQKKQVQEQVTRIREVSKERTKVEVRSKEVKPGRVEERLPDVRLKVPRPTTVTPREEKPKKAPPPAPVVRPEERPKLPPPPKRDDRPVTPPKKEEKPPPPPKKEEKPRDEKPKPPPPPKKEEQPKPPPPPKKEEQPKPPPPPPPKKVEPPKPPPPPPPKKEEAPKPPPPPPKKVDPPKPAPSPPPPPPKVNPPAPAPAPPPPPQGGKPDKDKGKDKEKKDKGK